MAKEKKRGFFSWLGFGRDEDNAEPQNQPAEQKETPDAAAEHHTTDHAEGTSSGHPEEPSRATVAAPELPGETAEQPTETVVIPPQPAAEPAPVAEPQAVIVPQTVELPVQELHLPEAEEEKPEARGEEKQPEASSLPAVSADQVTASDIVAQADAPKPELTQPVSVVEAVETPVESAELSALAEPAAENDSRLTQISPEDVPSELTETIVPTEQERPTREGFFARLKRSLVKTRQNLGSGFIGLFRGKKIDDELFEELEEQLLIADVGVETTRKIISNLTTHASRKQLRDAEALYGLLKDEMSAILDRVEQPLDIEGKTPFVILMVGVNGVGKTTTIGKLARQYQSQGKSVMLAAGDTFRAAAVEQLEVWGQRNNIPVVSQHTGADSASVIFDAIQAAKSRGIDVLIADTAGRLQNKSHLMEELKKITRVMSKLDDSAPHEVMLTIDASTGQNAISQARLFNEAVGLTGITLTKLDGTAKGGVIFSVADQFSIPIRYIGVGEGIDDLRPFKAGDFIEALFARED
ncbi:signal recognition particle-docking protein FtsY [Tatumella citrea]|uniref:Signal recognition particle receptor FtsY n=1 Tax=Tatumella citrea TaxID=53336 RepID=A0A1Y0L2X0_TATCI|nr:signal recognition particle-docking protein FtsY [Tatumella citrea]ARU92347.1 signal recognition particle-docking protein FtsY [Tatumella citrea]ARU96382.1 signal recognition particle-docking protein FtsY [Tatumella citrea]